VFFVYFLPIFKIISLNFRFYFSPPVRTEIQNNSFITSQIGSSFFSSTYSNPVNTCSSLNDKNSKINEFFQKEAEFFNAEMTPNESNGYWMAIPDEAFVAKHVLAEQIARFFLN